MVYAVILAGGKGLRLNSSIPKQLLILQGRSVLHWSVDTFINSSVIDGVLIVCEKGIMDAVKSQFPQDLYPGVIAYVQGGKERYNSSLNALNAFNFKDDDIILFHDAARPFVTEKIIDDVVLEVRRTGAAGTYVPAVDTVAVISGGIVQDIPDRQKLFYAQTPQGFRFDIINKAHKKGASSTVTDDVSMVMSLGHKVAMVPGDEFNFKITTDFDFSVAQFIAQVYEKEGQLSKA